MNDINEMPPKCQYCPYWEVCEYSWVCPDREQLATNLQQTCNQLATDTINRQAAIDAVSDCGICIQRIVDLPSAQPDKEKISDALYYIYRNKGTSTSAEGVAAIKYYIAEIWREIYGEEGPIWLKN